jgi:hypothetical protein
MKKFFVLLIAVLLCALALTSCGDPETTTELMNKIDEKMESLKSYQSDVTANISTDIYGYHCVAGYTGKQITIYGASDKFYYYTVMEGTTEMKDTEKNEVVESVKFKEIDAFHEGNMFVSSEQGDAVQKLYSPLTKDEYIAYLEKQESTLDIDYEACVNKSFTKNEDKTWTLTYSGYTKKAIAGVIEAFNADELFEEEIVDMEITIHANADFTVKNMELKMIFENESTTSTFSMTAEYSKYNEATPIVDTLDVSQYKKVADCRLLTDLTDMIEDLEELENGSFVLDLTQTLSTSSSKSTYTERDTVTYGKKDGKYFYDAKASTDNAKYDISYANGKQVIIVKEGSAITTVDDLYGDVAYKVGVQLGTTGDIYSTDDFGAENVSQFANGNEAVMALLGDAVDCVIIDNQPAKALVEANEGLVILETSYADEEYAICVAKENEELLANLNAAIDELIADGTLPALAEKYGLNLAE